LKDDDDGDSNFENVAKSKYFGMIVTIKITFTKK